MKQNGMDLGRRKPRRRRKMCSKILVEIPEKKELLGKNKNIVHFDNKMWREYIW
jgi:hypothetical protein